MTAAVVVGGGPNGLAAAVALAKAGRAGHGAGGRRRDRRRHPHQRGDRARAAARPLLGHPPDGRRLDVPQRPRPGPLRAAVAVAARSTACTRSTAATPACCTARSPRPPPGSARDGRRWRAAVRRAVGRLRRAGRGHHAARCCGSRGTRCALARFGVPDAAPGVGARAGCSAPRRRGRCSAASRRTPSGRCTGR